MIFPSCGKMCSQFLLLSVLFSAECLFFWSHPSFLSLIPCVFPCWPCTVLAPWRGYRPEHCATGGLGGHCKWLAKVRKSWAYQPTEGPNALSDLQNYGMGGGRLSVTGNCHWPLHSDEERRERDEWDSKTAKERLSVLSDISSQQQVLCNEGIQIYKDKARAIHYMKTLIKQIIEASACKLWSFFSRKDLYQWIPAAGWLKLHQRFDISPDMSIHR